MTDIILALNALGIYLIVFKAYHPAMLRRWHAAKEAKRALAANAGTPTSLPVRAVIDCVTDDGTAFPIRGRSDGSIPAIARPPGGRGAFDYTGQHDALGRAIFTKHLS